MENRQSMKGKKILVTGAGTGIGRGIALEFAREGGVVALHYSRSDKGAYSAVEEIRQHGGKAEAFQADFNDVEQARVLPARATGFLGGLDVLVNNAGITMSRPFEQVTVEQFETLFNVNIRAMFFVTQAAVPPMIEQGSGVVINMASGHAFGGAVEHTVYASTKGAIVAFTRTLSIELAQKGIRVNAIAPGWVLVENQMRLFGEGFDERTAALNLPAGFIARPPDIAHLAVFLASEEARFIIGQTVVCDGGQSALMPAAGDFRKAVGQVWGRGYVPGL
jgi:3-oxoacyl-[acyl-carrier protein] reductase